MKFNMLQIPKRDDVIQSLPKDKKQNLSQEGEYINQQNIVVHSDNSQTYNLTDSITSVQDQPGLVLTFDDNIATGLTALLHGVDQTAQEQNKQQQSQQVHKQQYQNPEQQSEATTWLENYVSQHRTEVVQLQQIINNSCKDLLNCVTYQDKGDGEDLQKTLDGEEQKTFNDPLENTKEDIVQSIYALPQILSQYQERKSQQQSQQYNYIDVQQILDYQNPKTEFRTVSSVNQKQGNKSIQSMQKETFQLLQGTQCDSVGSCRQSRKSLPNLNESRVSPDQGVKISNSSSESIKQHERLNRLQQLKDQNKVYLQSKFQESQNQAIQHNMANLGNDQLDKMRELVELQQQGSQKLNSTLLYLNNFNIQQKKQVDVDTVKTNFQDSDQVSFFSPGVSSDQTLDQQKRQESKQRFIKIIKQARMNRSQSAHTTQAQSKSQDCEPDCSQSNRLQSSTLQQHQGSTSRKSKQLEQQKDKLEQEMRSIQVEITQQKSDLTSLTIESSGLQQRDYRKPQNSTTQIANDQRVQDIALKKKALQQPKDQLALIIGREMGKVGDDIIHESISKECDWGGNYESNRVQNLVTKLAKEKSIVQEELNATTLKLNNINKAMDKWLRMIQEKDKEIKRYQDNQQIALDSLKQAKQKIKQQRLRNKKSVSNLIARIQQLEDLQQDQQKELVNQELKFQKQTQLLKEELNMQKALNNSRPKNASIQQEQRAVLVKQNSKQDKQVQDNKQNYKAMIKDQENLLRLQKQYYHWQQQIIQQQEIMQALQNQKLTNRQGPYSIRNCSNQASMLQNLRN